MKLFGFEIRREQRAATLETISVSATASQFYEFFGLSGANLPSVSIESALTVPAVEAAVAFLSRTLAAIPLHPYRRSTTGPVRMTGKIAMVIHENPNGIMDAFKFRQYFWQQVFTGGRGLAWIERAGQNVEALWPMDPTKTRIKRAGQKIIYTFEDKEYPAEDVIDVPFMLKSDQLQHYGPISMASKAIQLALAMNDYASHFFAGGGVPPLALVGPLPVGPAALQRAMDQVHRVIDEARKSNKPIFPMPPGHELKQIGFDPEKGQMTDARRFQIEEIARVYQLPPVFLQDLSRATFSNAEQQDLHLVKHLIGQWCSALEGEMNLKIFGRLNNNRYVEHNLDGLLRGDFKSRIDGITKGIQTALLTPNEGRALENRPKHKNPVADELIVQGATVQLGSGQPPTDPVPPTEPGGNNGDTNEPEA